MSKSNKYWEERVREQMEKSYQRTNRRTEKALARIYREQAEKIRGDILDVFSKIQATKAAGEPIQANDLYRNKRYWQLLEELNERLTRLGYEQIRVTEPAIQECYQETLGAIEAEAPTSKVGTGFLRADAINAETIVNQVWCLDGKKFSDRVWADKRKLIPQINKALSDAIVRGKSPWEIAKEVAKRLDVSRENAYRLVRTETAHAQNYAQTTKYKEMGFTRGKFLAEPDACDECRKLNGNVYTLDELETMIPVHPRCRCTYTLVED